MERVSCHRNLPKHCYKSWMCVKKYCLSAAPHTCWLYIFLAACRYGSWLFLGLNLFKKKLAYTHQIFACLVHQRSQWLQTPDSGMMAGCQTVFLSLFLLGANALDLDCLSELRHLPQKQLLALGVSYPLSCSQKHYQGWWHLWSSHLLHIVEIYARQAWIQKQFEGEACLQPHSALLRIQGRRMNLASNGDTAAKWM